MHESLRVNGSQMEVFRNPYFPREILMIQQAPKTIIKLENIGNLGQTFAGLAHGGPVRRHHRSNKSGT